MAKKSQYISQIHANLNSVNDKKKTVALKLGREGFVKSHAESLYSLIYGKIHEN
jgi:hypothetical protein